MSRDQAPQEVFSALEQDYTLKRYPTKHRRELRAWDTADLYLLDTLAPRLSKLDTIGIMHDHFGALTLPLRALNPICYGDSWMSRRAIELNLEANGLEPDLTFEERLTDLVSEHPSPQCVIGRIPKTTSQLIYLLERLNRWLNEGSLLILGGMDKHLSRGQYEQLATYFGPSEYLPGVKKARVWLARCDRNLKTCQAPPKEIIIPEHKLSLTALPNVFSRDKLDQGSRFFLEHLDRLPYRDRVADMACGYGVLGLAYLTHHPSAHMTFCDESFQAITSTRFNYERNLPNARVSIYADDGLKSVSPESLDLVICNPPFHQGHTVSADIAYSMFRDAHQALAAGGELWLVANRHLGYHSVLKHLFGACTVEVSDKKFVVLRSKKRLQR